MSALDLFDAPPVEVAVPSGMVVVSRERFFAFVGPRDIMPSHTRPDFTTWEFVRTREAIGRSVPGWRASGDPTAPKVWMLAERHARATPPAPAQTQTKEDG